MKSASCVRFDCNNLIRIACVGGSVGGEDSSANREAGPVLSLVSNALVLCKRRIIK